MKWGIAFNVAATYESDLWGLPPPSQVETVQKWDGTKMIAVLYHFLYSPQSWKEWQRMAGIKKQIKDRLEVAEFTEYERNGLEGKLYTVSELGEHFSEFVKFPMPMFPGKRESYRMLCRHAKRLHYEGLLFEEQLIATSIRFNSSDPEGMSQTIKRALAAYKFALDHRDEWQVKLDPDERHKVLSESALKSAQIRRGKSAQKRDRAKSLRDDNFTFQQIAEELGVSIITAKRWLR